MLPKVAAQVGLARHRRPRRVEGVVDVGRRPLGGRAVATVWELDRNRPCRGQRRGHTVERAMAPHLRLLQDAVAGQGHET